uniref:Venom allergen-1 n=1 Tax=Musca domestica TaxID=7370 RepID=A0A1I8MUB2_MUSDO
MKLTIILMGFLAQQLFGSTNANYCASNLCPAGVKHVACKNKGNFYKSCPKDATMIRIGPKLRNLIVNVHNKRRNRIAGGKVSKFRPACRMATMRWNAELAKIASYNVRQCKMNHDKCRNTQRFKFSGQNLAWKSYYGRPNRAELIKAVINAWYSEVKSTKRTHIQSYPTNYKGPAIGHFTAMMGERNIAVGCAASTYSTKGAKYKSFLVACNYATTNISKKPVYRSCSRATARCKTRRNSKYRNLCSPKERYNVNNW